MASPSNPASKQPEDGRHEDDPAINVCPFCQGDMENVYSRNGQLVVVCKDCHAGLTVPARAWEIARTKRTR
jgi:hypothetical protein